MSDEENKSSEERIKEFVEKLTDEEKTILWNYLIERETNS